uniref:Uncharacterized protein n=1 Tax=Anguilla anguilla TaxID=7936 RepID=A0A0E9UFE2_ANGAN
MVARLPFYYHGGLTLYLTRLPPVVLETGKHGENRQQLPQASVAFFNFSLQNK